MNGAPEELSEPTHQADEPETNSLSVARTSAALLLGVARVSRE
jgi:hypothetical protein